MLKGVHLSLLIGPVAPIPAPKAVTDALQSVQVTSGTDRSGFQLTFSVGKDSTLLKTLLPAGYLDPIVTRVIIVATVNGLPNVLMDGLVTQQELAPSNEPAQSTLTITGEDLSLAMDIVDLVVPYPAVPKVGRVALILAKYMFLGIQPIAVPPLVFCVELPTDRFETQTTTDRAYLKSMAALVGWVFYVEPGPLPGVSIAYGDPTSGFPFRSLRST